MADLIRFKRGVEANLPPLMTGEPGFADDTETLWVGTTRGNAPINKRPDLYDLRGKTINIFGDSISANSDALWPTILAEKYGCKVNNFSTSGIKITGVGGMAERIQGTLYNGADINIVFVGTNDWAANISLGTALDSTNDTVFGALNNLNFHFSSRFPLAKNYICSTIRRNGGDSQSKHYTLGLLNYVIYNVTKWHANQFLDLYDNIQFSNPGATILRTRWFTDDTHPNKDLQPYIADYIAQRIITNSSDYPQPFRSHISWGNGTTNQGQTIQNHIFMTTGGNIHWRFVITGAGWTKTSGQQMILQSVPGLLQSNNANIENMGICYYTGGGIRPAICYVQGSALSIVAPDAADGSYFRGSISYVSGGFFS